MSGTVLWLEKKKFPLVLLEVMYDIWAPLELFFEKIWDSKLGNHLYNLKSHSSLSWTTALLQSWLLWQSLSSRNYNSNSYSKIIKAQSYTLLLWYYSVSTRGACLKHQGNCFSERMHTYSYTHMCKYRFHLFVYAYCNIYYNIWYILNIHLLLLYDIEPQKWMFIE